MHTQPTIVRTRERRDCAHSRVRHVHGTASAYMHDGCRCMPCAIARSRYGAGLRAGIRTEHPRLVHIAGTRRRLQALAAIGWSPREISKRCNLSEGAIRRLRSGEGGQPKYGDNASVMLSTRDTIARVYDQLWATPSTVAKAIRIRREAAAHGWALPLAWDDDRIDDPAAEPEQLDGEPRFGLAPCGTPAAYSRHKARGERVDVRCQRARREYDRERHARRRATATREEPAA